MDFRKINCPGCGEIMGGAGACTGGRITIAQLKCSHCDTSIMVVPMQDKYKYSVTAMTDDEKLIEQYERERREDEIEEMKKELKHLKDKIDQLNRR